MSGLIYYVSLMAGLEVLERHPHSRDIYDDQTRYAPLGADATVAYGFKDLRVLNLFLPGLFPGIGDPGTGDLPGLLTGTDRRKSDRICHYIDSRWTDAR